MRYELLGREGGSERVILVVWRQPWMCYLTVKTPWLCDRVFRVRFLAGRFGRRSLSVQGCIHHRDRCAECREVIPADADGHTCEVGLVAA